MGRDMPEDDLFQTIGTSYADLGKGRTVARAEAGTSEKTLFSQAFEAAGEGMVLCSLDGMIDRANGAFCDFIGLPLAEVVDRRFLDLIDERSAGVMRDRLDLLVAGTLRSFRRDVQIRHGHGRWLWAALTVSAIRCKTNRTVGRLVLQVRDIEEARQVERVLLESDRRFRTLFNALSEGFLETDLEGRIVDVNEALCRMLGRGREALVGHSFFEFLDANSLALVKGRFLPDPSGGPRGAGASGPRGAGAGGPRGAEAERAFEAHFISRTGERLDAQVYATPLTNATGHVSGMTAIVLDVTEHRAALAALQASERRYRTLVDSIQDGLVLIRNERFEYVNTPFARMLGYTPGELVGLPVFEVIAPEESERVRLQHRARLRGSDEAMAEYETVKLARDGRRVPVIIHAAVTRDDDDAPLTIATVKDVTERRRIEGELRKLSSAVEQSSASVFITNARGTIEYINPKFTEVTGYEAHEVLGKTPALLSSGETDPTVYTSLWAALSAGRAWRGEFRNRRKDGSLYWEATAISPIKDDNGAVTHFVAVKEDVTIRKEVELETWQRANFDAVTGLPNRVLFRDRLNQAVSRARRNKARVAALFIDLDRFKLVNDTLGHDCGDEVLRQVATRLQACMRETDTVARLAGDEFTAILPEPGESKDITAVTTRILDSLSRPFRLSLPAAAGGQVTEVHIGGSIGIAVFPEDAPDASTLLKHADLAMYRAKDSGRNTYQFFRPDMHATVERRLTLEHDLRTALQRQEFAVHFQPVVDATTRRIRSAEALIRWSHPARGMMSPAEFLPVAEDAGLIGRIGHLVLEQACHHCAQWRDSGYPDLTVSVNVSARQLAMPDFLGLVEGALSSNGLEAHALELEISESLLLSDIPAVAASLRAVADLGVRLSIDDFGTSTSSLQHLRRFPFSTLKVDTVFVRDVLEDRENAVLVEAMIALARKLGLSVVAEGVETEEQINYLLRQYCDMFQGFLIGHPLPPRDFLALLARG